MEKKSGRHHYKPNEQLQQHPLILHGHDIYLTWGNEEGASLRPLFLNIYPSSFGFGHGNNLRVVTLFCKKKSVDKLKIKCLTWMVCRELRCKASHTLNYGKQTHSQTYLLQDLPSEEQKEVESLNEWKWKPNEMIWWIECRLRWAGEHSLSDPVLERPYNFMDFTSRNPHRL